MFFNNHGSVVLVAWTLDSTNSLDSTVKGNAVFIENVTFVNNSAGLFGGGTTIFTDLFIRSII